MKVQSFLKTWVVVLLVIVWTGTIEANELPSELIGNVHIFGPAPQMQIDATMTIVEGSSVSERRLNGWYRKEDDSLSLFVQVVEPPFLREMKMLLLRRENREDNWMRTSRGVRRLGASDGRERVFGSHFTVADMTAVDPDVHRVQRAEAGAAMKPGETAIDVLATGSPGYRRFFIREETRIITAIRFFDASGTLEKEYELIRLGTVEGQPVPLEGRMRMANGDETVITVNEVQFPATIPSRYFNRGNL